MTLPYGKRGRGNKEPFDEGEQESEKAGLQGRRPRRATPLQRSGAAAERSNPTSKERLLRGAGGLRGAIPRPTSGGAAVRRYPSSKVRSSGCALLQQPRRDNPRPR